MDPIEKKNYRIEPIKFKLDEIVKSYSNFSPSDASLIFIPVYKGPDGRDKVAKHLC